MPVRDHLPIPSARFVRMRQTNSRYLQMYAPLMCTLFRESEHLRIAASLCVAHIVLYISPRPHQCEVSSKKKNKKIQNCLPRRTCLSEVYRAKCIILMCITRIAVASPLRTTYAKNYALHLLLPIHVLFPHTPAAQHTHRSSSTTTETARKQKLKN